MFCEPTFHEKVAGGQQTCHPQRNKLAPLNCCVAGDRASQKAAFKVRVLSLPVCRQGSVCVLSRWAQLGHFAASM